MGEIKDGGITLLNTVGHIRHDEIEFFYDGSIIHPKKCERRSKEFMKINN